MGEGRGVPLRGTGVGEGKRGPPAGLSHCISSHTVRPLPFEELSFEVHTHQRCLHSPK